MGIMKQIQLEMMHHPDASIEDFLAWEQSRRQRRVDAASCCCYGKPRR